LNQPLNSSNTLSVQSRILLNRQAERMFFDLDVDLELAQRLMEKSVELRHRNTAVKGERPPTTVVCAHDECIVDKVEADLERRAVAMQSPGGQAAHVDVQRHVPPVIARGRCCQTDLADDLAVQVQRVLGWAPVSKVQLGQCGHPSTILAGSGHPNQAASSSR
jgi:hypothetical protein